MKKIWNKLFMVMAIAIMAMGLVACGNATISTADETVSISGKVSTAKTVEVAEVEETSTEYVELEQYLEENTSVFTCYDIKIADETGNPVQPDGAVEVKIKLTDALIEANGNYAVFYVNGENFTKLDCSEAEGYVTFTTEHFSVYVVAKYEVDKSAIEELASGTEMEIPHIHKYEAVADSAIDATCTEEGKEADESCSCGEVITGETIPANGHQYGDYVYNNDATTKKDGTETATCSVCGVTDTRTKEGTKLSYAGYDEFGNGYVIGSDGYKHFDADCPYPIFEPIWVSNAEVIYYGPSRWPQLTISLGHELAEKNGVSYYPGTAAGATDVGYYNGQFIIRERVYLQ